MNQVSSWKQDLENGFAVGRFRAEPQRLRISSPEGEVRVEPKVMEVLLLLAEHQGKTVTKEQFMDEVWSGTIVTGDALLRCISELRRVFDDDAREPAYIETIRKRGYRLIMPVALAEPPAPVRNDANGSFIHPFENAAKEQGPAPESAGLTESVAAPVERRNRPSHFASILGVGLAALSAVVVFFLTREAPAPPAPTPLNAVPFTTYPGEESDPNLSPDGKRVAFVWNQGDGGSFDIFVKQLGVETPQRLTNHAGDDSSPTWSPDGQYIAFLRTTGDETSLHIVPSGGGTERTVLTLGAREAQGIAWSPDGRHLALSSQPEPYEPFGITIIDLETLGRRTLTQPPRDHRGDFNLAFSPDGQTLAFSRSVVEKADDIFLIPASGGELKRLTHDRAEITGLDWSMDGGSIIYSSDRLGSPALWRAGVAGGQPVWIPTVGEGSGVHQPSVARLEPRMSFVQRFQETNIWLRALDSSRTDVEHPLIASTRWDSHPDYAPDGSRIAFASNRSGSYEIWVSDRSGSNLLQVTSLGGAFTNNPRWSPDGRHVAFVAHSGGSADIYVTSLEGSKPHRITTADSNDKAPSWSRDGQWIYFASNRSGTWQIWKKAVDGGDAVRVTENGGYAAFESRDGRSIYFVKRQTAGIWSMPLDGGAETLLIPSVQPYDWGNWCVTDEGIYFVRRERSGAVLAYYDFATASERSTLKLGAFPKHPALSVSPDGSEILYTRIDRIGGDLLLVEDFR